MFTACEEAGIGPWGEVFAWRPRRRLHAGCPWLTVTGRTVRRRPWGMLGRSCEAGRSVLEVGNIGTPITQRSIPMPRCSLSNLSFQLHTTRSSRPGLDLPQRGRRSPDHGSAGVCGRQGPHLREHDQRLCLSRVGSARGRRWSRTLMLSRSARYWADARFVSQFGIVDGLLVDRACRGSRPSRCCPRTRVGFGGSLRSSPFAAVIVGRVGCGPLLARTVSNRRRW